MKSNVSLQGVLAAVVSAAVFSTPVLAGGSMTEVMPGMHVVSDAALAGMRGKYVSSTNKVVYFGVQLSSNWSSQSGNILSAGGSLALDVSSPTPSYSFTSSARADASAATENVTATDTSNRTIDSSGVSNASGVTQSIQVAGDDNALENVTRVSMLEDIPDVDLDNQQKNSRVTTYSADGTALSASSTLGDDGLSVKLSMGDQGEAEQSIRSYLNNVSGNGVIQSIKVLGDRHRISNQMNLDVVMQKETQDFMMQQGVGAAINNLRGLKGSM